MKIAALVSGGKDSIFSMMHCLSLGHEILCLGNLYPAEEGVEEVDSWMYQSIGASLIPLLAECISLPLIRRPILGKSLLVSGTYVEKSGDEVEDLFKLLSAIKEQFPDVQAICSGAILSSYQRVRVENVCSRLGLVSIAPLWMQDQDQLLRDMIASNVGAVLVKTAAVGLDESDLAKPLSVVYPKLLKLNRMYDLHICGEGGEYETFTLDAPFFKKRIEMVDTNIVQHSDGVWYLTITEAKVVEKSCTEGWIDTFSHMIDEKYNFLTKKLLDESKYLPLCVDHLRLQQSTLESQSHTQEYKVTIFSKNDNFVAISGTSVTETGSIFNDTEMIMQRLSQILLENGSSLNNCIQVTIYLKDMSKFAELNRAYAYHISASAPPTRVTVEVCPPINLQIDILAYKSTAKLLIKPTTLYVQGMSYWAPSNIGPYSQAVRFRDSVWLSGMIGLVPCSMELASPLLQAKQSLESVKRVAKAVNCLLDEHLLACVCYVTSWEKLAEKEWVDVVGHETSALYILVPRLPKDAVVEWQATLFSIDGYREMEAANPDQDPSLPIAFPKRHVMEESLDEDNLNFVGKLQVICHGTSSCITGWLDYAAAPSSTVHDLAAYLLSVCIQRLKGHQAVTLKLFYPSKYLITLLEQENILKIAESEMVAVTFVPVLQVAKRETAVGISLYRIKKEYRDPAQIGQTSLVPQQL